MENLKAERNGKIPPKWLSKKSTMAIFLKKKNFFVIRRGERFQIEKFAMFVCTENKQWTQMTADMFADEATVFFFNVNKEKAFLENCSGVRTEIKKLYFVWEELGDEGIKGIFIEKRKQQYSIMNWDSSFMNEANQLINRELLKIFFTIVGEKGLVEETNKDNQIKMISCMDEKEWANDGKRFKEKEN